MVLPTVDLTAQRAILTRMPGANPAMPCHQEIWFQDAVWRALFLTGALDIHFDDTRPPNPRQLWFKYGSPPTGQPGRLHIYSAAAEDWVPAEPRLFVEYLAMVNRPRVWRNFEIIAPNVHPNLAIPGDWWWDADDASLYYLVPDGPGTNVWMDITGAYIDPSQVLSVLATREFTFRQTTPAITWVIDHNLNRFPHVTVLNDLRQQITSSVSYPTTNQVVVEHSEPVTGEVFLS